MFSYHYTKMQMKATNFMLLATDKCIYIVLQSAQRNNNNKMQDNKIKIDDRN